MFGNRDPVPRLPSIVDFTVTVESGEDFLDDVCGILVRSEACIHGLDELVDAFPNPGGSQTDRLATLRYKLTRYYDCSNYTFYTNFLLLTSDDTPCPGQSCPVHTGCNTTDHGGLTFGSRTPLVYGNVAVHLLCV